MNELSYRHADYNYNLDTWTMIRDFYNGEKEVKKKTILYLPIISNNNPDVYKNYIFRATFLAATTKSIDVFFAMLFRKDLKYSKKDQKEFTKNQQNILNNLNLKGDSIHNIAKKIVKEVILLNRFGILVDYQRQKDIISLAEDKTRPFIIEYKAEDILDWELTNINGVLQLSYIKLVESNKNSLGTYEYVVRECYLNENLEYEIKISKTTDNKNYTEDIFQPKVKNKRLNFIPFFFFDNENNNIDVKQSIMLPLVNLNHKHYLNSADYEWGLHFTALPTPVVTGFREDQKNPFQNTIGPTELWKLTNENAKAFYLEFQGTGLAPIKEAMKDKEDNMAKFGTRIIGSKKLVAETAAKAEMDNTAEESQLSSIANNVSEQLKKVIEFMFEWYNEPTEINIEINKDFIPQSLSPEYIKVMHEALRAGEIDLLTFYNLLQKEELTIKDDTFEKMQSRLELQGPTL
jgi:DNA-binding Lrp family transcriptional regulator